MTVIETERLILRPMHQDDAPNIVDLFGNWDVIKMTSRAPYPYALSDAEEYIALHSKDDDVTTRVFSIQLKDGPDGAIGAVGIHGEHEPDGQAELGYWIGEPYWGKGYMKEATQAAVTHAFKTMGMQKLVAGHFEGNPVSRKILLFLGFVECGNKIVESLSRGQKVNCPQLSLSRENWQAMSNLKLD